MSDEFLYEGSVDSDGLYHGKGSLIYVEDGVKYEGDFVHGEKEGKGSAPSFTYFNSFLGSIFFPDGSSMTGTFSDGALEGPGVFIGNDGSKLSGDFVLPLSFL